MRAFFILIDLKIVRNKKNSSSGIIKTYSNDRIDKRKYINVKKKKLHDRLVNLFIQLIEIHECNIP